VPDTVTQQTAAHPVKSNDDDFTRGAQIDKLVNSLRFQTCMMQATCTGCPVRVGCPL